MAASPIRLADVAPFAAGALWIDPASREVRAGDEIISIEPRVMQVLIALTKAGGSVVSRDMLIAQCWDGRIVGDDAINRAVSKVREIGTRLKTDALRIETVAKVGYRLIVPDQQQSPAPSIENGGMARRLFSRRTAIIAGAGAVSAGVASLTLVTVRTESMPPQARLLLTQGDNAMRLGLPESDLQAAAIYEKAANLAPRNARVWGKLALARQSVAENAAPDNAAAALLATQDAVARAVALDPRQVDALSAQAVLAPFFRDWRAAELRMRSVLSIDPHHFPTLNALDFFLTAAGRPRYGSLERVGYAGVERMNAVQQFRLALCYWQLGRIEDADRTISRAEQLWPKHPGIWFVRLWTLCFTGRAERALAQVEDAGGRPALPPWMIEAMRRSMMALVSQTTRDVARAREALVAALVRSPAVPVAAVMILTALNDVSLAFDVADAFLLDRGPLMARLNWRPGQLSVSDQHHRKTNMLFVPATAPMRSDPRFAVLVRDIGLEDYWRGANVQPDYLMN